MRRLATRFLEWLTRPLELFDVDPTWTTPDPERSHKRPGGAR